MKLEEAIRRAEGNESVRKLRGYFLGSTFACVNVDKEKSGIVTEWTLLYYNPRNRSVVDCFVNDKFVTVGEETPAISEMEELDINEVNIDVDDAMQILEARFKKKAINVLISLHRKSFGGKSFVVWTIGMVTPDISVTSFDIDASNGNVLKEETTRLIKKL